jgi:hypothetical protein
MFIAGGLSAAVQRTGREVHRSPPSNPEVKNERSNTSTTLFAFSCMLLNVERFDGYFVKRKGFGRKHSPSIFSAAVSKFA